MLFAILRTAKNYIFVGYLEQVPVRVYAVTAVPSDMCASEFSKRLIHIRGKPQFKIKATGRSHPWMYYTLGLEDYVRKFTFHC